MVELDFRTSDGIDVSLLWHERDAAVWISVSDQKTGDHFSRSVPPAAAADAFRHPYAYDARERALPTASAQTVSGP